MQIESERGKDEEVQEAVYDCAQNVAKVSGRL